MRIDEETLTEQILEEEASKRAGQSLPPSARMDSSPYPAPIRLHEDRSTDMESPPVLLDIASSNQNLKSFSLADFARTIQYIRLETPSDSNLLALIEHYQVTRNAIITDGINGIAVFTRSGEYIETVSRNSLNFSVNDRAIFTFSRADVEGKSPFSHFSVFGEEIFYRYDIGSRNLSRAISYSLPDQLNRLMGQLNKNIGPEI